MVLLRNYLQTSHHLPRRRIIALIDAWAIFLNGEKVENYKAELSSWDQVSIPSLALKFQVPKEEKKSDFSPLLLFHKPTGYTCSKSDPHNPTFYELLPPEFRAKYYYIGRLDKESRGLMLLTSDPALVHQYEHPSKQIPKSYLVQLNHPFDWSKKTKILNGIYENWELLRTLDLSRHSDKELRITLNEGKKRHIRRIFKSLGYEVTDLKRISIWTFKLWKLAEGQRCIAH